MSRAALVLDLIEFVLWFLPDAYSIGRAARVATNEDRASDRRLAIFAAPHLEREQSVQRDTPPNPTVSVCGSR